MKIVRVVLGERLARDRHDRRVEVARDGLEDGGDAAGLVEVHAGDVAVGHDVADDGRLGGDLRHLGPRALQAELGDLLSTIIETNVSVERLADFKRAYYDRVADMRERLPQIIDMAPERVEPLLLAIYYHAVGFVSACWKNPLVAEALETIGHERPQLDFRAEMRDFIGMCLAHYAR